LALPWTIPSPTSLFNVVKFPALAGYADGETAPAPMTDTPVSDAAMLAAAHPSYSGRWLAWLWAAGALSLAGCAAVNHYKIRRRVAGRRPLIDATTLNLLEDCKALMGVNTPVTLIETEAVQSPSLFGFVRPRLLLPSRLASSFSREELRHVFLHELAHVKRNDIFTGWLMLALQILHWFNPLVWLAFHRLRADRELACDALALAHSRPGENEAYGLTIVKLLEGFGRSVWAPSLVGILENKQQMKERINMIARFRKTDRGLPLALSLFAGLAVVSLTDAQINENDASGDRDRPRVIATSPVVGATAVDPAIKEITVTFDRDMAGTYSWTGRSGTNFPPSPETGAKPAWRDRRTCVLPVKLEAGRFYRVGINHAGAYGFRGVDGVPALPSAVYFTTEGASAELMTRMVKRMALVPRVVGLTPPHGATGVIPAVTELRVTFDMPMEPGFSFCGGGRTFPSELKGKGTYWTEDRKTCVWPVELKPHSEYDISLNSAQFKNFRSEFGVPVAPVSYQFKTAEK
jgi:beta-lactamase regulating signal transducer with metallopeptidase domain